MTDHDGRFCHLKEMVARKRSLQGRIKVGELIHEKARFFKRRLGGLNFLLRCNYDVTYLNSKLPTFYKDMLSFFDDLKKLYIYNLGQLVLFNNREILIDGKPLFNQEWFLKGVIFVSDLLDEQGQLLSYQAFKAKYKCKTNFLNCYRVRSAIPDSLLTKAKNNR